MSNAQNNQEPSMDEILSSIRRIISEDEQPGGKAAASADDDDDDVMELTEVVGDDGDVGDLYADDEPAPAPAAAPAPKPRPQPVPQPAAAPDVHDQAARAAQGSMARLQHAIQTKQAPMSDDYEYQPKGGETVEGLVYQILKPMLREWVDRNLPQIVEGMVAAEIRKMTGNS